LALAQGKQALQRLTTAKKDAAGSIGRHMWACSPPCTGQLMTVSSPVTPQ